jgi:hypothetical protein
LQTSCLKDVNLRITRFRLCQNQEIEGFSVNGSQLPELEAEVVQIQAFVRLSLRYLISMDQQDLVLAGFLFLFWGPLADSSLLFLLFWILESFCL